MDWKLGVVADAVPTALPAASRPRAVLNPAGVKVLVLVHTLAVGVVEAKVESATGWSRVGCFCYPAVASEREDGLHAEREEDEAHQ